MMGRNNLFLMLLPDDDLFQKLSHERPNNDFLVISQGISRELHQATTKCVGQHQTQKALTIFLTTYGGDPHGGYRVARCLRHHYEQIRLVIPSYCKSAGTLIAIAADELAVGDLGELGPLDVQVTKPSEPQERGSGLDVMTALTACADHAQQAYVMFYQRARSGLRMSPKVAGEAASQVVAGLMAPLYSQIDPLRIGEMQRAMSITLEYGTRLNGHSSNLKQGSLDKLVIQYPAHGFVIDRKEAATLFNKVSALSDAERYATEKLWSIVGDQSDTGPFFIRPVPAPPQGEPHGQSAEKQPDAEPPAGQDAQPEAGGGAATSTHGQQPSTVAPDLGSAA